jgi:hypothetical protein
MCISDAQALYRIITSYHLVRPAGVEPTTLGFGNQYSIQLSYGRNPAIIANKSAQAWGVYSQFLCCTLWHAAAEIILS